MVSEYLTGGRRVDLEMKERGEGQAHLRGSFGVVPFLIERDRLLFFPLFISFVLFLSFSFFSLVYYGD